MTTAFVLSGGGSLGAVQVGMLQALDQHGVRPELLVGTSAGAINAAYVAGHGTGPESLDRLADLWRRLRRNDVFPVTPLHHLLAVAGARSSVFKDSGLRRLLEAHVPYSRLEDAPIPVHLVATELLTGEEVPLSRGDVVSAVLASAAVPGLLPAVRREGQALVDGGLTNNTAISQAIRLGADRVFVLPTGYACALPQPPATPLAAALHALGLLTQQRLIRDLTAHESGAELRVLPPLCPLAVSPADFGRAGELVDRARLDALGWLESGAHLLPRQERFLSLHSHEMPQPASRRPA